MPRARSTIAPFPLDVRFFFGAEPEDTLAAVVGYLKDGKGKAVCLNDGKIPVDKYEQIAESVLQLLDAAFPDKCEFEL